MCFMFRVKVGLSDVTYGNKVFVCISDDIRTCFVAASMGEKVLRLNCSK